jgi:hypothetical protein
MQGSAFARPSNIDCAGKWKKICCFFSCHKERKFETILLLIFATTHPYNRQPIYASRGLHSLYSHNMVVYETKRSKIFT